jgi:hypothetical protein
MTSASPKVAHAFADLMNGHDPDAVDGFVAADYVDHNAFVADGLEANRTFWAQWFAAFPDTVDPDPAQLHRLLGVALDDVLAALSPLVEYPSKDPS